MLYKYRSFILSYSFVLLSLSSIRAQYINRVYTVWDDTFSEWTIESENFKDDEWVTNEGLLRLRYMNRDDWTEWTFEQDDIYLDIRLKWKDNPNYWEMVTPDGVITAKTVWRNDFSSWRIQSSDHSFTLESKYKNTFDEWRLRNHDFGNWEMETEWEGDPREWNITDDMSEQLELSYKLMFTFIVLMQATN